MADAVNYRVIQRKDLSREDCPWFNPRYGSGGPSRDQVLLSILGEQPVCYALFEESGDIELKYVENAPSESGKGYAIGIVREVLQRYPDRAVWGAATHPWGPATHPRTPNLLRKAGFSSPWEVEKERGGFRVSGAWVRYPPTAEESDTAP